MWCFDEEHTWRPGGKGEQFAGQHWCCASSAGFMTLLDVSIVNIAVPR